MTRRLLDYQTIGLGDYETMLRLNNIEVVYSDVILVLRGVSLEVGA